MKKKLAGLALTLGAVAFSAACATSGAPPGTTKPQPPQPDSGQNWAKAEPSGAGNRVNQAAVPNARLTRR